MKISIASYAFHGLLAAGQIDVFGYLESCKYRYQLNTADIWNGMLPTTDEDYIRKVKAVLDERELTLVNLCVDGAHIWEDDPDQRENNYQNALAHLKAAEILGARTVRIDAGVREDTFTNEQLDWIVKRFSEYARRANDHGYRVGPENHWGAEVHPANMLKICQGVNHPAFGVLLHFRGNEGDAVMAPYAMHTHVSWDITLNNLEKCMNTLDAVAYTGYWGVEHHSGKNEYANVAVQLALVRKALAEK